MAPGACQEPPELCSRPPRTPPVRPRTPKCQCGFAFLEILKKIKRSFLNSSLFFPFLRLSLVVTSPYSTPRPHLAHTAGSKSVPGGPRNFPSTSKELPRSPKEPPKSPQGALKTFHGVPKEPPKSPKESPRAPQAHPRAPSREAPPPVWLHWRLLNRAEVLQLELAQVPERTFCVEIYEWNFLSEASEWIFSRRTL